MINEVRWVILAIIYLNCINVLDMLANMFEYAAISFAHLNWRIFTHSSLQNWSSSFHCDRQYRVLFPTIHRFRPLMHVVFPILKPLLCFMEVCLIFTWLTAGMEQYWWYCVWVFPIIPLGILSKKFNLGLIWLWNLLQPCHCKCFLVKRLSM